MNKGLIGTQVLKAGNRIQATTTTTTTTATATATATATTSMDNNGSLQ